MNTTLFEIQLYKTRILQIDDKYYPQYKLWFWWLSYFNYRTDDMYQFKTLSEANEFLKEIIDENLKLKCQRKSIVKIHNVKL